MGKAVRARNTSSKDSKPKSKKKQKSGDGGQIEVAKSSPQVPFNWLDPKVIRIIKDHIIHRKSPDVTLLRIEQKTGYKTDIRTLQQIARRQRESMIKEGKMDFYGKLTTNASESEASSSTEKYYFNSSNLLIDMPSDILAEDNYDDGIDRSMKPDMLNQLSAISPDAFLLYENLRFKEEGLMDPDELQKWLDDLKYYYERGTQLLSFFISSPAIADCDFYLKFFQFLVKMGEFGRMYSKDVLPMDNHIDEYVSWIRSSDVSPCIQEFLIKYQRLFL